MQVKSKQFKLNNINKALLYIGVSLLLVSGYAQSVRYPLAARYTAMGAYSKNFADVLSTTSNQAALVNIRAISAGVYAEKRFFLKELNVYSIGICLPISFGVLGMSAKSFGYSEYNETQIGIAYGKALGNIDIGIQFNYNSFRIPGYGNDDVLNIEVGSLFHISEQLYAGIHVFNPTGVKFGNNNNEELASVYRAGLGFEASKKVFLCAEVIKEEDKPVTINAGFQYAFAEKLVARLGLFSETTTLYFGIGFQWNQFRMDITSSYHPQLGFTPGLMLLFKGINKEE